MRVNGVIADVSGQPLSGYQVVVLHGDVNLKKERPLGTAKTDENGEFSLTVDLARYPLGVNARLAVRRGTRELWSSPIYYNTQANLVIDATIPEAALGISEYERLTEKISPLLQGRDLAGLQPGQITYLAGRSGLAQEQVNQLIAAALLHNAMTGVSAEAAYGLLSQGLPANVSDLAARTAGDWRAALGAAARGNVIASLPRARQAATIAALTARKAAEALHSSSPAGVGAASFAAVAFGQNGKAQKIATLAARYDGVNDGFWRAVERDRDLTKAEREKLRNYAAVSEIVGRDPDLLRGVAAHLTSRGEQVTPAALATLTAPDLQDLIEAAAHANPDSLLKGVGPKEFGAYAAATAGAVATRVAAAFPTQTLRAELKAAPRSTYFGRYTSSLETFFERNGDFDLRDVSYDELNGPKGADRFRGIPDQDKDAVKERLAAIIRLFRALPEPGTSTTEVAAFRPLGSFATIAALADNGYRSSSAISTTPKAAFVAQVSAKREDDEYWGRVHDRAMAVRDVAWVKGVDLLQAYRQPFFVIKGRQDAPAEQGVADLRTLFGSLDMCDCEACTSITSPAAYLADVLNFLGTDVATAGTSPYEVLTARRPDIRHILLNCDNTNRALPYIDLVNEVLEDEVLRRAGIDPVWSPYKPVMPFALGAAVLDDAASDRPVTAVPARKQLVRVLNKELPGYGFDADTQVSVVTRGQRAGTSWHVFGRGWLVELSQAKAPDRVSVNYVSRQTVGTDVELTANPAFRNARATHELEGAKFPLSLPPGLPLQEARLFLNHLQVPRARLLELLAPQDANGWAIEYLGLSAAEATLVTSPGPALYEAWGFPAADVTEHDVLVDPADSTKLLTGPWSERLRRVDVLIARAGITYVQLLDLLVTNYVNPPVSDGFRPVTIESVDTSDPATCELAKLRITGSIGVARTSPSSLTHVEHVEGDIGAPGDLLDRLLRFLRLQRRTGWTPRELDTAIRQVRPGVLDSTTLELLAALKWTTSALHLGHTDACALFGAIDTMRYVDHAADGQPALPSQYDQLFLNRAVTNPVDPDFALDDAGTDLRKGGLTPAGSKATIAAAYQVSEADVALLAKTAAVTALDVQGLSDMYRRVLFARGFKLTVQEMDWIERLAGTLPPPGQIPEFVERVTWLLASRISAADAWFLLQDTDATTEYLRPRDNEVAQTLGDLRAELQKIAAEHPTPDPPDPDGELLRKRLGELDWGAPLVDNLVGAVTDTKPFSVQLTSLPAGPEKLLNPGAGDPAGVPLSNGVQIPDGVDNLVAYDAETERLRALHPLSRSDRKRLLLASASPGFRGAAELLFALGKLSWADQALTCRGLLPAGGVTQLAALDQAQPYQDAIRELADQQQQMLNRKLRYCTLPQYEIDLGPTTLDLSARPQLGSYVYYDSARNKLVIRGQLTDAEQKAIEQGAAPHLPPAAVQALPTGPGAGAPAVDHGELRDLLATTADVSALFDPPVGANMPATTAEIAGALLAILTGYAGDLLSRKAIVSSLSGALGVATSPMRDLLEQRLPSATGLPRMADAFMTLRADDARAPVDPARHAGVFDDYRRLSKIALLFQRLAVEDAQVPWLFDYAPKADWLYAANLTSGAATGSAGLKELSELVRLFRVVGRSPYSVTLLDEVLRRAADPATKLDDLIKLIGGSSSWSEQDLADVCKDLSVSKPDDLLSAKALDDLREAMTAIGRLGATAAEALRLTHLSLDDSDALLAKSLAKSKHDPDRWLEIVKPINDNLREARRSALVDYLVASPRRAVGSGWPLWHDADSLYDYLLVDVQMGACMTTSRARLALSSAQLFVQRCLMNLEPRIDVSSDDQVRLHWNEWESWRKLYRVWEANRKIFLFPEDWIEPDLRDDKTPFFSELEDQLLQNDVTKETAETAFLDYLHKLDHVSKLEVMGMFVEDETRILHVVARTAGEPYDWFYRKLTTTSEWYQGIWSPWEKLDADITGDHVLPVVWNHHLYVFWAIFEEKADKPTSTELADKDHPQEARNRWYIKLAWSECKSGRWSPKRVSKDSLRTPAVEFGDRDIDEASFSFKSVVTDDGVTIRCYGPNFNDPAPAPGTTAQKQPPPEKEGYFLAKRTANCGIWFRDQNNNWATNLTVLVYEGDTKLLTLESKDGNGFVEIWKNLGATPEWKATEVELRTTQNLFFIAPLQAAPADWYLPRDYSRRNGFDPLYAQVQVVENSFTSRTAGPETTPQPGLMTAEPAPVMSRVGRFGFQACRGDLTPVEETTDETIPDLEESTELRGMMYVEKKNETSFLRRTLNQPRSDAGRYRVLVPHQYLQPDTNRPLFFQDDSRVYLVTLSQPRHLTSKNEGGRPPAAQLRFDVFYHPYVCDFIARVNRQGIDELLTLESQALDDKGAGFGAAYKPSTAVQVSRIGADGKPVAVTREYVDFERSGSYSIYNWELFFHAPFLIATKLTANQRFEEARAWLHRIFDPTTRPGAFNGLQATKPKQRFWNVRPFWEIEGAEIHSIDDLLRGAEDLGEQYAEWRAEPFKPFVVARLRKSAFMQSVVMRYLDNLIDWGDQQFNLLTMESTNEATLLYMLAAEILGRRPEKIPPRARPALQTYLSLERQAGPASGRPPSDAWQNFSDLMVEIEAYVAPSAVPASAVPGVPGSAAPGSALGRMWAFCIPANTNLLQYWTTVADRLFKLRHCQDIEGTERKIPLWDPPIDPAILVRAAAAGVDLSSVLSDINAALPNYRFSVILPKALELCSELKNFGAALLLALEKKDAEALSRLRSQHEVDLFKAVRAVKSNQLAESTALRDAAEKSKLTVEARRDHYRDIAFLNPAEAVGLALSSAAVPTEIAATVSDTLAAIAAWVPQYSVGTSGFYSSPVAVTAYGGEQVSRAASAAGSAARSVGAVLSAGAAISQTIGSYLRRQEEWELQETLADKELAQIEKQIGAATIREAIAQAELDNHDLQTEQAKEVDEHLRSKYTNQELYGWMQGQLAGLYFQTYKLAFDMAKKAERACRHELGLEDSSFVQFGYWDNLKSGLLAGERLQADLRRMEAAYLDLNRRELEITKHVSLAALDPAALIALKAVGTCEVDIQEWLFDLDYPGHYMRRIKSVGLSIPCVTGRYTNVNCTLTQSFSKVRTKTTADVPDYDDAEHFHENFGSTQTIVTSTGRQDSGLFELNFRDERYLPFEGTGAISRWRIRLPREDNRFDVGTVSDVVFHIHYTARDGGEALREVARTNTKALLSSGVRVFDARADFASDWYRFKNPETGHVPELTLHLGDEHFPFHPRGDSIGIQSIELICAAGDDATSSLKLAVALGSKSPVPYTLAAGSGPGALRSQEQKVHGGLADMVISGQAADVAAIEELLVMCHYKVDGG